MPRWKTKSLLSTILKTFEYGGQCTAVVKRWCKDTEVAHKRHRKTKAPTPPIDFWFERCTGDQRP